MAYLVELTEPRKVGIRHYQTPEPGPGEVLVRTLYSGISAGTELATYRGTNPYLAKRWDPELALFLPGETTFRYPVDVWGYSEVGVVEEVGPGVTDLAPGDQVWGIWGHRSHAVLPADRLVGHLMPAASTRSSAPSTGSARWPSTPCWRRTPGSARPSSSSVRASSACWPPSC